jgi:hypothetical protein
MSERCAVYFAPPPGSALADFAAAWFGRSDNREATASPRHYGFHATLKPPFRFAEGLGPAELETALADFAATRPPVEVGPLQVGDLSGFLALVPREPPAVLGELAMACVERFDRFRAPPHEAELARRRAKPLTPRQDALLERWGYPYVAEEFRFHMTLTQKLPEAERARWKAELERLAAPALAAPLVIDALALFHQPDAETPFAEIGRVRLAGSAR